ncbi:MAG: fibronectin type III domain-containing protein, partial [Saprospiraceae bacterium]
MDVSANKTTNVDCTTPGVPQNVTAIATGSNSASLDWTAGVPSGSPTITYFWVVGTNANVLYGAGIAQGTTLGNWTSVNGLLPGTVYFLRVFAQTSCNNAISDYGTAFRFTTIGGCSTPGAPQNVTATATGPNTASLDWTPGNPAGSATVTYYWVVGTTSNVAYGAG